MRALKYKDDVLKIIITENDINYLTKDKLLYAVVDDKRIRVYVTIGLTETLNERKVKVVPIQTNVTP